MNLHIMEVDFPACSDIQDRKMYPGKGVRLYKASEVRTKEKDSYTENGEQNARGTREKSSILLAS